MRESIEKEKEQMEREKQELMMKLYEFEETTKRAERGGANHVTTKLSKYERCLRNGPYFPSAPKTKTQSPPSLFMMQ